MSTTSSPALPIRLPTEPVRNGAAGIREKAVSASNDHNQATAKSHEQAAFDYVRRELGNDAPPALCHEATYADEPLEGEGTMSVFSFDASIGGEPAGAYRVVAGDTVPNYYPHWGLSAEQAYQVHIGTRFMLALRIAQLPESKIPPGAQERVVAFIGTVAPGEPVCNVKPAAAFDVDGETYAVFRATIADVDAYVLGAACPPGIYREVNLPPHVIFRRHLGAMILREARDGRK